MEVITTFIQEIKNFFGFGNLLDIIQSGNYRQLLTYEGFTALIRPFIPVLLVLEITRAAFYKRFKVMDYKISFFTFVFYVFIGMFVLFAFVSFFIFLFAKSFLFILLFIFYCFFY